MLRRAVAIGPDLNKFLLERNRELEAAGYHAQVHVMRVPLSSSCFKTGAAFRLRESNLSTEQLTEHAEQLSPNALLRPVVQDYMLPTAAYVGGPAELAYFAQSQVFMSGCWDTCRDLFHETALH